MRLVGSPLAGRNMAHEERRALSTLSVAVGNYGEAADDLTIIEPRSPGDEPESDVVALRLPSIVDADAVPHHVAARTRRLGLVGVHVSRPVVFVREAVFDDTIDTAAVKVESASVPAVGAGSLRNTELKLQGATRVRRKPCAAIRSSVGRSPAVLDEPSVDPRDEQARTGKIL